MPFHVRRIGILLFVAAVILALLGCGGPSKSSTARSTANASAPAEDIFTALRDSLKKGAVLDECRGAVQQLNEYLGHNPEDKPPSLAAPERGLLSARFALEPDELTEIDSGTFTPLDVHHFDSCILLRDASENLQVEELPPLDRASSAFAFAVRQVRLHQRAGGLLPPSYALRGGAGNSVERAQVFLGLLRQLGLDGCMIAVSGTSPDQPSVSFPLAGALIDKAVYLFDARMGLPLPGPNGKGIATLAQLKAQPELLQFLKGEDKLAYDLTADQARKAEVYLAVPLSALAPRMRWLQEHVASHEKVALGVDPAELLARFEAVTGPVKVLNWAGSADTPVRMLRSFLPTEEGGTDKTRPPRRDLWVLETIPFQMMPQELLQIGGEPGNLLRQAFGRPFLDMHLEPNRPRDLILRGRFDEATTSLVKLRDETRVQTARVNEVTDLSNKVAEWRKEIEAIFGGLLRAQAAKGAAPVSGATARELTNEYWKKSQALLYVYNLSGSALAPDVTYLLALCKHEQAEQAQTKLERLRRSGAASERDAQAAQDAWRDVADWWDTFLAEYPNGAGAALAAGHRARALEMLGQRDAAVALLKLNSSTLPPLQQLARQVRIKQLQAP